jgi:phage tail sheath protein FI
VRRLFNTVERDARATLRTMVFEPNNAPTWEAVRSALDHYLFALWRKGALQGETPAQAYFVQIGLGATMTPDDVADGRMIAKVGMAAVRPAEFIVLQFTQDMVPS